MFKKKSYETGDTEYIDEKRKVLRSLPNTNKNDKLIRYHVNRRKNINKNKSKTVTGSDR